jgi:hypothetical protein
MLIIATSHIQRAAAGQRVSEPALLDGFDD